MKCLMAGFVVTRHTCEKTALPQLSVRALLKASGFEVPAYLGKNSERNLQVRSGFNYPPTQMRSVGHFRRRENARVCESAREVQRERQGKREIKNMAWLVFTG